MARTLTTPEDLPNAVQQAITGFSFNVPHVRNAGDTAMEMWKAQITVSYEVTTYDIDGNIISRIHRRVDFADWTAGFKTNAKDVYDKLVLDAENNGLIYGPGTDEALE